MLLCRDMIKVNTITCHEGTDGEYRHRSTLSLTSALVKVCGQRHTVVALPPVIIPRALCRRLCGPQGQSGRVRKISLVQYLATELYRPPSLCVYDVLILANL